MNVHLENFAVGVAHPFQHAPSGAELSTHDPYTRWGKRLVDISLVLLGAPLIVPFVIICAGLVAMEGGRPFFWQPRVGRGGVPFHMLKLRSMCRDAEQKLADLLKTCPAAAAEWETSQKLRRDPRITKVGAVLRKTSLDELPQLWNVLVGEMSLVGPRPMMPSQSPLYPGSAYYRLRPGVTGPWQVFARNHHKFSARAEYDAFYEVKQGFAYDLSVIRQTWRAVSKGTGQ